MRKTSVVVLVACTVALAVGLIGASQYGGDVARGVIVALVALAGPVTAMLLKARRSRTTRSDRPDSVETALAKDVQAVVFRDVLVALPAAFLVSLLLPSLPSAIMILVVLLIVLVDFWLRYSRELRRVVRS
jgi:hypothetical protein